MIGIILNTWKDHLVLSIYFTLTAVQLVVISFFQKGQILYRGVCLFQFYGICNEQESDSACVYGKISHARSDSIPNCLVTPNFLMYR